tara:strand:+ start:11928 stop:12974 length:1047 start_codon:yes stop_codon:yes gene_type:complete
MEDSINILVTGAGSPGGPGIIKCLINHEDNFNIFICDADEEASGKYLIANKFMKIPKADEPEFVSKLLKLCIRYKINIILPLVTKELLLLSKNKEIFHKNGIKIIVSDFKSLNILNDKGLIYSWLQERNIKVPKFFFINNSEDLLKRLDDIGFPENPFVLKPRISNGSRGVRIIDKKIDKLDLLFNQKPNSLYMNLDDLIKTIENKNIPPLIISEFLPGEEVTVDTIIKDDNLELILIRTRDRMRSGISIKGKFIKDKKIEDYIKNIIKSFKGLNGPIGFQLKRSVKDEFLLLECNPRIQGTSVASLGLGINIPVSIIKSTLGIKTKYNKKYYGISFSRYYEQIYYQS